MFQQKETAEDLEEITIPYADVAGPEGSKQIRLPKLLVHMGLAASGAEANRKIAEKAVKIDGEVAESVLIPVSALPARIVVRLGKRAKITVIV
jgi:tyrosyl-tRNA synthetase